MLIFLWLCIKLRVSRLDWIPIECFSISELSHCSLNFTTNLSLLNLNFILRFLNLSCNFQNWILDLSIVFSLLTLIASINFHSFFYNHFFFSSRLFHHFQTLPFSSLLCSGVLFFWLTPCCDRSMWRTNGFMWGRIYEISQCFK